MKYDGEDKFVDLLDKVPNVAVQGYNKKREVIYWNEASEKIYGFTKEEVFGKRIENLIVPNTIKESVIDSINNWFENGEPIPSGELILKHKDGSDIYVYSSHVLLKEDTKNPEMFCIDVDLSQRIKKDLEIKKKDKLLFHQSKMAEMGQMLGNIAHQWRQPLSMISVSATGAKLQNELGLLNENSLNSYFDKINDAAQYLSKTIDDFRSFFNPQEIKEKEFKISDVVNNSLTLVSSQFTSVNIEVIQNIEDIELKAVKNELIQVLINILNNAKDALLNTKNQKRFIFINAYKYNNNIIITIKDNAKGIPDDIIDRVFEPYFTTKFKSQGTGIGLYMSVEIIKKHFNGTLNVENVSYTYDGIDYNGALFTITIPMN